MRAVPARDVAASPTSSPFVRQRRRVERRFAADQDGVALIPGRPCDGIPVRICNISSSGMQLETSERIRLGVPLHIQWSGLTVDGAVCYEKLVGDRWQLGVELSTSWELLVSEILARQSQQIAAAKDELERRNQELAAALDAAREASDVKSRFLASVSHELRTPLNGILGFTQMLFDGNLGEVSGRQKECLGEVLGCSRHLLRLVNDLLDMSMIEAGCLEFRFEKVSVAGVISSAVEQLRPLAEAKRLRVEVCTESAPAEAMADPTRLRQIFYNYLSNAVKFTPCGGHISVRVLPEGETAYRIEVEDSGPGIPASELHRLFSEFCQLENCGSGGAGLGLALTKHLVEAHGGSVGVRSEPGSGSAFHAILPLSPRQPARPHAE